MKLSADSASGYRGAAVATLAAAVAGLVMLSGIVRLHVIPLQATPLVSVDPLPGPTWPHVWLDAMQSATRLQAEAVQEWLNVALALLFVLLAFAGISALISLFAHATARRYEVALSAVVGASRAQLTALHLRKAGANTMLALVAGLPIGLVTAVIANRSWPHVAERVSAGAWVVLAVVFASTCAAVVARIAAARMSRPGWMGDVLAPEARTNPGTGAEDLRGALLHLQFAFTFAVLAAALLVWQAARPASRADSGGSSDQIVTRMMLDPHSTVQQRRALHQQLERAGVHSATPGVLIGVGPTDQVLSLCGPCSFGLMSLPIFPVRTQQQVVSAGFFDAAGIPLTKGRDFEPRDASHRSVVVNDTFASLAFQGQHPIGKQIQVGGLRGQWYTVVGVVRDVPIRGLLTFSPDDRSIVKSNVPGHEPAIYFYAAERPPLIFDSLSSAPVRAQWAGVRILGVQPLSSLLASARAPARWFAGVLGALALTSAIVALLSLAAMTLLNVRQRELEIAAHRAVGARRRDIIRMTVRATLLTCLRGAAVGAVVSVALARAVQMVLPEMAVLDARVLGATALAVALVSLAAAVMPARAAARVAPAQIHT